MAIAGALAGAVRESDFAARTGLTSFVVALAECDRRGVQMFVDRLRTRLSTEAYARMPDGGALYIRCWAGWAEWEPGYESPEQWLTTAQMDVERRAASYEGGRARAS